MLSKDELMKATRLGETELKRRLIQSAPRESYLRARADKLVKQEAVVRDSWAYISMLYLSGNPSDLKDRMLEAIK